MDREQALQILRRHKRELSRRGVRRAAVFGSMARGQQRPDSDLDIMVQIDPAALLDVYGYVALTQYIGDLFPTKVDVANQDGLKPRVRALVERDAVYAF